MRFSLRYAATRVMEYKNNWWPSAQRLILSDEALARITPASLLRWPIGTNRDVSGEGAELPRRLVVPSLERLNDRIWESGRVKALLILRNQPEWLASLYAQESNLFRGASQKDFEAQVESLIARGEDYIDWSRWVDELHNTLGPENVCTLFMEEMPCERFWEKLAGFMEMVNVDTSQLVNVPKKKVRGSGSNKWKIRAMDNSAVKLIEKYWRRDRLSYIRRKVRKLVNSVCNLTRPVFDPNEIHRRDTEIAIPSELRERILEYCRPFNERLAEQLEKDRDELQEMGYFL